MSTELNYDAIINCLVETSKTMEHICKAMQKLNESIDENAVKIKAIEATLEHWEKRNG